MTENRKQGGLIEARVYLLTVAILVLMVLAAGGASYFIPAGTFVDLAVDGKTVKAYQAALPTPVPAWKILLAPLLCVTGKNGPKVVVLTLFILIIGGSFSIMNKSGVLPGILSRLVNRFSHKKTLFLVGNVILFSLLGSCLGILEEIVPMILIFVPLAYSMKWDSVTGLAIPFLSAGFGFAAATFNPFTVGTAQKLADLPLFSGLSLRIPLFVLTTAMVILYLLAYTRRIERDPSKSLTYGHEVRMHRFVQPDAGTVPDGRIRKAAGLIVFCFILIVGVVVGGTLVHAVQDLAFPLIALVFLIMGVGSGLLGGAGGRAVGRFFVKGLGEFSPAILLILLAASVGYLIEIGNVMDTILYEMSQAVAGLGKSAAVVSLYFFQMGMNFFVPSGTGQAVLTIPILASLGDLVGISRQTVVLAFQFGDGFSNLIWPTNPLLLIAIGLAGVSYKDWFKWVIPLQLGLLALCVLFLLLAVRIGYA